MAELTRVSISLEGPLLAAFDKHIESRGYENRSEAIRDLIRDKLVRDRAADTKGDAYGQQLGDFWASCMDEAGIARRGAKDLEPELKRIDGVHDGRTLAKELAHLHTIGVGAAFDLDSEVQFVQQEEQQQQSARQSSSVTHP